jgi:G3E family GTPase
LVKAEHEDGKGETSWSEEEKDVLGELCVLHVLTHHHSKADSVNSSKNGGLNSIAKIGTTVTVIDALRFFDEFETIELLHQCFASEVETPEDERTVTDLMIDQIEFADVIIVSKMCVSFYHLHAAESLDHAAHRKSPRWHIMVG